MLDSKHPMYCEFIPDWVIMTDTYRGERVIKDKGQEYLPATSGMVEDGMATNDAGKKAYDAYKLRAYFHEVVKDAVTAAIGVMYNKPPVIELPAKMEPLREKATVTGESLNLLLRRINEAQLVDGRFGLLADVESDAPPGTLPYISTYAASSIINWDTGSTKDFSNLNLVILNESGNIRQKSFEWKFQKKFRVLILGDTLENEEGPAKYKVGVFIDTLTFVEGELITPSISGKSLEEIPFVFVNSKDLTSTPDDPPLLGLAKLALVLYRSEADYRQNLFMQGQDTLVIKGGEAGSDADDNVRVGAGATIHVNVQGDAKYIGVSANGLSEQRQAIENDQSGADRSGAQILENKGGQKETGEALKVRVHAKTATLNQIAISGGAALEQMLKMMAVWVGANPEEVKVYPNLDFVDDELGGQTLVEYMTARTLGAPLTKQSIHKIMKERGLTDLTFEEEMAILEAELADEPDGLGEEEELNQGE
jgi:ribosomal protein L30E